MIITDTLKKLTKDLLSEEALKEIENAVKAHIDSVASEKAEKLTKDRLTLQVEKALTQQDADYTLKVEKMLSLIDTDHCAKLTRAIDSIDTANARKLGKVVSIYEKRFSADAKNFKALLIEKISRYLDKYIDDKIPMHEIKEAVQNKQATSLIAEMRNMLGIDLALSKTCIREAVIDGQKTISDYKEALDQVQLNNRLLTEKLETTTASLVLEQKLSEFTKDKKEHFKRVLGKKDVQYITENFDYIVNMYETGKEHKLDVLKEEATSAALVKAVDRPIIESTTEKVDLDPYLASYVKEMQKHA